MTNSPPERTYSAREMNDLRKQSMKSWEKTYSDSSDSPPPSFEEATASSSNSSTSSTTPGRSAVPATETLNFESSPLEIPTPAECIAHLKLLHAFAQLRHDVGNNNSLYGVSLEKMGEYVNAALAERVREKKWIIFVTQAVSRFETWWDTLAQSSNIWPTPITMDDFDSTKVGLYADGIRMKGLAELKRDGARAIVRFTSEGDGLDEAFDLPPLDVLMVWHAYMLNPRTYLEDCIRFTKHALWRTKLPWERICHAIDNETFAYHPGTVSYPVDTTWFQRLTRRPWNALSDTAGKEVVCPKCGGSNQADWTKKPSGTDRTALEAWLSEDTGYASPAFTISCSHCQFTITHENLRLGKFITDANDVLNVQRPLSGTTLNALGSPQCTLRGRSIETFDSFFPSRVIQTCESFQPPTLRENFGSIKNIEGLKVMFENIFKSHSDIVSINAAQLKPSTIAKGSRVAVRKMLSHYWDNSSKFGIDLVGAVIRQGTFIQKMHKFDWLHSPSIMSTTQRLIVKYHRFVLLAADSPRQTVVPTLDVDLAWHTHQLAPRVYYAYTVAETKKFLNHDDKIPEGDLHTAFQATSLAYEKKYGQPYSECSCWYCECVREPLRSNFLSSFRRLSIDKSDEKRFTQNPHIGVHVSAHNALDLNTATSAHQRRKELEQLDLQYAKVVKRYQKGKQEKEAPKRDNNDAYMYGAYGYPIIYPGPVYVPYYADPHQQQCLASGGGPVGACAAGTCAASTSMGGCAGGIGSPSCGSSCGGAGGGGGGCGGGGGGCGGGS